ncbi:MAG: hypothetical protein WC755_03135 [Candidatus Woesearchaeota archaeon]|jgi:hypothetical protein
MKESDVENIVREYVAKEYPASDGWKGTLISKKTAEHGADIERYNQKKGDRLIIEVKKWDDKYAAMNHNAFYALFGQLLSRIHEYPSKIYQKRRKLIIAVPEKFVNLIRNKIHRVKNNKREGMIGGWRLFGEITNLRIWSVDMKSRNVTEYHWKDLLKN